MSDKERAKNIARFRNLMDEFMGSGKSTSQSIKEASRILQISVRTGWRWYKGEHDVSDEASGAFMRRRDLHAGRIPDPLPYDKLSDLAKRMLAPDGYPLFLREVFGWEIVPWEQKAAEISVQAILDKSERHYAVCNIAPGSGKSSNWSYALPVWLNMGGGFEDPARGRLLRFQLGHASKEMSKKYVQRIKNLYASPRPYWDPKTGAYGNVVLSKEFGRLKPLQSMGDISLWQDQQFVVAQLEDVDLADKDPTFMAVAPGAEYIGGRCEYASWDDLVTQKTTRNLDQVTNLSEDFVKEAENRIEPGGILWLVGQRIASFDLFRDRLDDVWIDDDGEMHHKYFHITFPAHHEATCDGDHRQWDAEPEGDGCLLDAKRLPWRDLLKVARKGHFRTVFQQEDTDPTVSLVTQAMIDGGTAYEDNSVTGKPELIEYPGNWDPERGFGDFPPRASNLVNYVTVDPAAGGKHPGSNWVIEWWATAAREDIRYLIWATRQLMQAGDLLDWDEREGEFVGWMEKLQAASVAAGHPIRVWVIEANSFLKHLFQYRHYRRWCERWPFVTVIPHETQRNKWDEVLGVEAHLRTKYRNGRASLPRKTGDLRALTFMNAFVKELTTWPRGGTDDTVMADWFGEANIETILRLGHKPIRPFELDVELPQYLVQQRQEVRIRRS